MVRILVPAVALMLGTALVQPAAAQSGVDLVKQAVAAQGGAAALGAAKTTIIKGEAKHWEPGQSYAPTGEPKFLGDSTYTQTVDNANRTVRIDWDRDMKYPAVERHQVQRDHHADVRRRDRRQGRREADVGHSPRGAPARARPRLAAAAAAGAQRPAEHHGAGGPEGRRSHVAGGLDQEPRRHLYRAVRPHHASAGGGAHPRRRQRLRRLQLRPDPLGLEGRRRRQARAHAVVPAQRRRGAAADLEGGHRRCAAPGQHLRGQRRRQGQGEDRGRRRTLSMGAAAHVPRPLPRQRQGLLTRRAAASSFPSWRPTCSRWSAAAPTT